MLSLRDSTFAMALLRSGGGSFLAVPKIRFILTVKYKIRKNDDHREFEKTGIEKELGKIRKKKNRSDDKSRE